MEEQLQISMTDLSNMKINHEILLHALNYGQDMKYVEMLVNLNKSN